MSSNHIIDHHDGRYTVVRGKTQHVVNTVSVTCSCGLNGAPLCAHYQAVRRKIEREAFAENVINAAREKAGRS